MPRIVELVRLGQPVHVVNEADACLAGTVAALNDRGGTVAAAALHLGDMGLVAWLPHRDLRYDPAGSEDGTFHLPEECPWRR